jgi:hypothetical protein
VQILREALYRTGLWTPEIPQDLKECINEFISANRPYWPRIKTTGPRILIEGHLSQYGPNYLFRSALVARAFQENKNCNVDVIYNGYSYQWVAAREVYSSFGIDHAIFLGAASPLRNVCYFLYSRVFALWLTLSLKSGKQIVGVKFGGIIVGDLIYDDIIKAGPDKTINRINPKISKTIARSLFFFLQYQSLFRATKYSCYVATHTQYSEYGLLCRVALAHGVNVIETTDIQMSHFRKMSASSLPTYHEGVRQRILGVLGDGAVDRVDLRARARLALRDRMGSKVDQIDAKKAYVGKVYDRRTLSGALGIDINEHIVFIVAHVCADAPHASSMMLHADYYHWLVSTLDIAVRSVGVTWVVKPHPSSAIYGEMGLVEKLVEQRRSPRLRLCPPDFNVESIRFCADALVTVYGTAGLEFSCLGIPVVLAGRAFYSGFEFTHEPQIVPLSAEQIDKALEVYGLWNDQFDWNNPIITTEVLANVWGSGKPRDLNKAYTIMSNNLRSTDPRKLKLWEFSNSIAQRIICEV